MNGSMITAKRGDSQPPQFVLFQGYTTPTARTTSTTFTVLLLYVQANKSLHNRVVHRALETLQHVSKTLCQSDLYCIGVSYRSEEHARLSGPPHHRDTLEEGTIFSFLCMCALSLLWPERSRAKTTWPGLSRRWYASFSFLGF